MLTIEIEGKINKMQGEKFKKAYERASKSKKRTRASTYRVRRIRD